MRNGGWRLMGLLAGAFVAGAAWCATAGEPEATAKKAAPSAQPAAVFAADSFWYTPIPAEAPLHPNSANFVAEFLRQKKAYYGTVSINTTAYASPVYIAGPDTPRVRVAEWDCQKKKFTDAGLAEQWSAVPVPAHAEPADGTDAEMTIYQPASDTIWEFWQARKVDGQWQACWGGRMPNVSKSSGIWQKPYGTTATGLPFLGGQITAEELRRGKIEHVMGISLVDLRVGRSSRGRRTARTATIPKKPRTAFPRACGSASIRRSTWTRSRCTRSARPSPRRRRNTASSCGTRPGRSRCGPRIPSPTRSSASQTRIRRSSTARRPGRC